MRFFNAGLAIGAVFLAGAAAASQKNATEKLIEKQGKLCFARVYDAAHLKAHPAQKVERVFVMIGKGKASTYWEDPNLRHSEASPKAFASPKPDDPEINATHLAALVTLRGAKKPENVSGWCSQAGFDGKFSKDMQCGGECDHQIGNIRSDDGGAHLIVEKVEPNVLISPEDEEAGDKAKTLGADDKTFKLDARPLEDCVAEANKTNSRYVSLGAPLRERLKSDAPFCYGRDYSAAHLAAHPAQVTAAIRVFRDAALIAADRAKGLLADWPDGAGVAVSVTTRAQGKPATLRYFCTPFEDQWECTADLCKAGRADCTPQERENTKAMGCDKDESRTIFLRRGEKDFMMLGNANIGLPLDGFCGKEGKTASDDKLYRLEPMPAAACETQ